MIAGASMEKKEITIKVKDNMNLYLSDILCWFAGYKSGKGEDSVEGFLEEAMSNLRDLNRELKDNLE